MSHPAGDGRFPTTSWTLIARLRSGDEATARLALDELCAQYHYPLYCYIRRRGLAHHDAEDALHDFLAKLLRLDTFAGAEADKGLLRSFLSHALARFLINWHRDRPHRTREVSSDAPLPGGEDEARYAREPIADTDTPERLFDRKWGHTLLARVIERLRARYAEKGNAATFAALLPILRAGGSLRGEDATRIAAALGTNQGALRVALNRLLARYRTAFEEEVLQTVSSPDEAKAEIAHLMQLFGA